MSPTLAAAVLVSTMRLVTSHGYADGAPPGFSGGFSEDSCHACHFHEAPNAAPGRLTIEGLPAAFTPGQRYTLTIVLRRPGMKLAGFQLAARFKDGGAQAGTLAPGPQDGDRVAVESEGGVQYAGQKKAGTSTTGDAARWTLVWTAPRDARPVVVHAAANAADGNDSADGDFVYTVAAESGGAPAPLGASHGATPIGVHADGARQTPRSDRSSCVARPAQTPAAFSTAAGASPPCSSGH